MSSILDTELIGPFPISENLEIINNLDMQITTAVLGGTSSSGVCPRHNTIQGWSGYPTFVPDAGEIIVYDDYTTIDSKLVPAIKIGDGQAYLPDLPFINAVFDSHINNNNIHVSTSDRSNWNNKVSVSLNGETLIFLV